MISGTSGRLKSGFRLCNDASALTDLRQCYGANLTGSVAKMRPAAKAFISTHTTTAVARIWIQGGNIMGPVVTTMTMMMMMMMMMKK